MNQSDKKWLFGIFLLTLIFLNLVSAADTTPAQPIDCRDQTNPLIANLTICEQDRSNINESLEYYKNLSGYYQELYESKEINITNRELINIYNTLNLFQSDLNVTNTKIENVDKRLTIFSLEFGISIISLAGISVAIIEATLHWRRKRKQAVKDEKLHTSS